MIEFIYCLKSPTPQMWCMIFAIETNVQMSNICYTHGAFSRSFFTPYFSFSFCFPLTHTQTLISVEIQPVFFPFFHSLLTNTFMFPRIHSPFSSFLLYAFATGLNFSNFDNYDMNGLCTFFLCFFTHSAIWIYFIFLVLSKSFIQISNVIVSRCFFRR